MFSKGKNGVAVLTACVYLLVYGFPLSVYGQDTTATAAASASESGPMTEDDSNAGMSSMTNDRTMANDTTREYYGGGAAPAVRRGMASASAPAKIERKMLVDTSEVRKQREQELQDSLAAARLRAADLDSVQRGAKAPALRLGKRGKIAALISSVVVVSAAAAYAWYTFVKSTDDGDGQRIPDPPALPGI